MVGQAGDYFILVNAVRFSTGNRVTMQSERALANQCTNNSRVTMPSPRRHVINTIIKTTSVCDVMQGVGGGRG